MPLTVGQGEDLRLSHGLKLGKSTKIPNNPIASSKLPTAGTIHYNAFNQRFEGVLGKTTTFNNSRVVPLSFDIASTSNLGCIKIGNNLTISNDGILNATANSLSRQMQRVIIVSKAPNTGDFTTIQEALEQFFGFMQADGSSVDAGLKTLQANNPGQFPDPSADNMYIIFVSPGIYEETTIDGVSDNNPIKLPPYVALIGDNPDTCIIKCSTGIALETNTNSIVSNLTFDLTSADTNVSNTDVIGINSNAKSNNKFENLRFISSSFTKNIFTIKCLGSSNFTIDKVNTDFDTSVSGSGNINNIYITEDSSNNGSSGIIKNCTTSIKTLDHNKNALKIDGKSIVTAKYNEFIVEEYNSTTTAVTSESINLKNSNLELLHSKIECIGFDNDYTNTTKNLLGIKLNSTEALASITKSNGVFVHYEDNNIYDEIQFLSSQISAFESAFFTYESFIKVSGASNAENNKVFRVMNAYEDTGKFIIQLSPNDNLVDETASGDITIKELYSLKLFSTQVFSSSHSIYSSDNNGNYRIQVSKSELTGNDPSVSNDLLVFNYPHFITVGSKDCDFVTISSAMNSIQDASVNKQYIIKVKPGDYYESSTLTIKEYVSLIGESETSCALYFDQKSDGYPDNTAVMLNGNTELKNMKINLSAVNLDSNADGNAENRIIGISTVNLVKTINLGNATSESGASLLTNIVLSDIEVKIEKNVLRSSVFGIYIFKSNYEGKNIKVTGTTNSDQDASFISIYDNATMQTINGFGQSLGTGNITDLTVNISGNKSDCHMNGIFSDRAVIEMNNPSVEIINNGLNSATTTPPKNLNKAYNVTNLNDTDFPDGHTSLSEFTNIIFGGIIKSKTNDTAENENYSLFVDFNATLIALSLVTEGENKSQKTSTNNLVNSILKTLNCYSIIRGSSDEITSINDVDKVGLPTITSDSLHIGDPAGAINAVGTKNVLVGIRTGTKNTTGTRNTIVGVDSGNTLISGNDNSFYGYDSGNLATGSGNILMGSNTATTLGTGDLNTVIGKNSGKAITTMNKSTIIGSESVSTSSGEINDAIVVGYDSAKNLNLATNSLDDIIIGNESGNSLVSGVRNIVIGNDAAKVLGTATGSDDDNIMIGHESGMNVNTSNNVIIGTESGKYVSTGTDNTFIGYNTGKGLIDNTNNNASKNVIIGKASADKINSGNQNVIIGAAAAQSITDGDENIIIGSESTSLEGSSGPARSLNTGSKNIIMGTKSAELLTTGSENIVLGCESGKKMETTSKTIIIGVNSGNSLAYNGVSNAVIIGHEAAQKIEDGSSIVIGNKSALNATGKDICIIGNESGKIVTGARNTFIGNYTAGISEDPSAEVDGEDNILIGTFAGFSIQSGSKNVIIGSGNTSNSAGRNLTKGDSNLIMGYLAGRSLTEGDNNIMFGRSAGYSLANASKSNKNVFIGNYAGNSLTEGENNLIIGNDAGKNITSADSLLLIGQNAGFSGNTSNNNVFIGNDSGFQNSVGGNNAYIGNKSGYKNTESQNTIIGVSAGEYSTSAADNTFIGYQAGRGKGSSTEQNNTGDKNTFIGFESGLNTVSGYENLYLGYKSGHGNELGAKNIMIGSQTGLNSSASNNIFIGTVTDTSNTVGVGANTTSSDPLIATNNIMIGTNTGINNTFGAENIFIGSDSGKINTFGSNNIYFGDNAGKNGSNSHKNICIGKQAGEENITGNTNIIIGNEAGKTIGDNTDDNIIIGNQAGQRNNIDSSIFIGAGAGKINTTGSGNIFLGKNAGLSNQTSSNNIMIGSNSGASCAISGSDGENIYIGHLSGDKNISGTRNIVIGSEAFDTSTQGSGMIAMGYKAGKKTGVLAENVGGNTYNNTIIGFEAGSQGDMNINNVLIGAKAGRNVDNPRKFANNLFLGTESGQNSNLATQSIVVGNASKTGTGGNKNIIMGDSTGDNLGNPRLPVSNVTTISTISSGDINAIIDLPYSAARYYFDDGDNILIQDSDQSNFHETTIAGVENNITNTISSVHNVITSGTTSIASGVTVNLASATTVKLVIGTVITFNNNGVLTLTAEAALGSTSLVGDLTVANLVDGDKSISIISESKSKLIFSTKYSNSLSQTIANGANIISLAKLSTKIGDLDDSKYSANTLMGHNTGSNITLGSKNVALGPEAFVNNKKGKYNNVLGTQAAYNVKSDNNTCMGTRAGFSLDSYSNTNNTIATNILFTSNTNTISSGELFLSTYNFGTTFEISGSSKNDGNYIVESSSEHTLTVKGIPQIEEIGVPNNVDPDAITISGDNFNFVNSTIIANNFQVVSLISGGVKYTGLGPQTGQNIDTDVNTIKNAKILEISGSKFNDGFYYIDDETTIPTNISSNIKILILNANLQPETFTSSVSIKLNNIKVNTISSLNNFDDLLNDNKFFIFFGSNKSQMTVSNNMNYFPITKPYNSNATSSFKVTNTIIPQETLLNVTNDDNIIFTSGLKDSIYTSDSVNSDTYLNFFKKETNNVNISFTPKTNTAVGTITNADTSTNLLFTGSSGFIEFSNTSSNNKLIKISGGSPNSSYNVDSNYSVTEETDTDTKLALATLNEVGKDLSSELSKGDLITIQYEHTNGLNLERGSFLVDSTIVDATKNIIFLNTDQFINPFKNGIFKDQFNPSSSYPLSSSDKIMNNVNLRINKDFQKIDTSYIDSNNYLHGYDFMFQTGTITDSNNFTLTTSNTITSTTDYIFSELVPPVMIKANDNYYLVEKNDFPHNKLEIDGTVTPIVISTPTTFPGMVHTFTPSLSTVSEYRGKILLFKPDSADNTKYDFGHTTGSEKVLGTGTEWTDTPPDNSGITSGSSGWTILSLGDDELSSAISLSANNFTYFGETISEIIISSNGNIQLDSTNTSNNYINSTIGHWERKQISFLWDDLNPISGGTIKYGFMTTTNTNDTFVLAFIQVHEFGTTNENSVQVKLFLDNAVAAYRGNIEIQYGALNLQTTDSVTIGISNGIQASIIPFNNYNVSNISINNFIGVGFDYSQAYVLQGKKLTFFRNSENLSNYDYTMELSYAWTTTPPDDSAVTNLFGWTTLNLGDESYVQIFLSITPNNFTYFGNIIDFVYITSNGNIVFDISQNPLTSNSITNSWNSKRISFFWTDLNQDSSTGGGGTIKYGWMTTDNTADTFVLVFSQVHEYNTTNNNSIQVKLFLNNAINDNIGKIEISYGYVDASNVTVGISNGVSGSEVDFTKGVTNTTTNIYYNSISSYNNSSNLKALMNTSDTYRVIGANNNNLKEIKVQNEINTLQESSAYLTTDSNINTYNSNDMVISLETNHKYAKGYRKGFFKNLSFTSNNVQFVQFQNNNNSILIYGSTLTDKMRRTIQVGDLIKPSGVAITGTEYDRIFRIISLVQTSGNNFDISIDNSSISTSNPITSTVTFTINQFESPFINFSNIYSMVGMQSKFLRFSKVRLETEHSNINTSVSTENAYIDKSMNFTNISLNDNSLSNTIDKVFLDESVPNEYNPFVITPIYNYSSFPSLTGTFTQLDINEPITNYIPVNTMFRFFQTDSLYSWTQYIYFTVTVAATINSTNPILYGYFYGFDDNNTNNDFLIYSSNSIGVQILNEITVTSGPHNPGTQTLTVSTLNGPLDNGTVIHFKHGGILTLTSAVSAGANSITGTVSVLSINNEVGIVSTDLDRFDNYAISIGTPVVSAGGDASKEKQNIETPPRGFINTFIDSADNGATPSITVLDTSVDQLQGTITLVKDTSADGAHTMELSSISIVSGKIYTVKNTPLGYLDLINTPFKFIRPNTYLRIQYDTTGTTNDFDYTVMVDKLINNKKIQFKFVEGVFSNKTVTFDTTDTLKISIRFQNNLSKVVANNTVSGTSLTVTNTSLNLTYNVPYPIANLDSITFPNGSFQNTTGGIVTSDTISTGTETGIISKGDVSKSVTIASNGPNEALSGQIISNRYNFTQFKKASASENKTITDAFSLVNYLLIHKLPILNSKISSLSEHNYYYNNYKIPDSSLIDNNNIANLFDIYIITTSGASATDTSLSVEAIKHNLPIGTLITFPSSGEFRLTSVANVGDTTLTGVCDSGISSGDISISVNINPIPEVTTDSGMSTKTSSDNNVEVAAVPQPLRNGSTIIFYDPTFGSIQLTNDAAIGATVLIGNIKGEISASSTSSNIILNSNSINSLPFSYDMNTGNLPDSSNEQIEIYDKGNHSWVVPTSNVSSTLSTTNLSFKNVSSTGIYNISSSGNTITKTASSNPFNSFAANDLIQLENSASNNDGFYKISSISSDNKTITIDSTYNTFKADETTDSTFNIISQVINSSDSTNTDLSLYNPGQKVIVTETENNNNVMLISEDTPTTPNSIFITNSGQITTEASPRYCKIEKCIFKDEETEWNGHNDISFNKNDSDSTLSTITTSNSSVNLLSFVPNQPITISGTTLNNGNFIIGNSVPSLTQSPTTYTLNVPINATELNQSAIISRRVTFTKLGEAVITTTSTGVVKFHYLDAQGNNTMIGSFTGQFAGLNAYSIHNLFIGNKVGQTNQGSGNIFIGNETGFATSASDGATTFNNKFAVYKNNFIGVTTNPLIGGDFASGTVGINTINPDSLISTGTLSSNTKLVVNGKIRAQSLISFTGCHNVNITSSIYQLSPGMILVSTGTVSYSDNIDTLVSCQISTSDNQKTVYGVYIDSENIIDDEGNVKTNYYCASIGEGTILVTNINGNVLNGDYITTSLMPGYGKRQDDDILRSYTVAKCTETILWDNISNNITYNGSEYKSCRVACTYHCG
tara:strand:- start:73 stop:14295 length:14223 start_codon:yes stop_codon:yes gene_type:complete